MSCFFPLKKKIIYTYKACPEGIQPCNMKSRDIYWRQQKIQETLYIRQWYLCPLQSRHLGTSHSSPVAISCPIIFCWISSTIWSLFSFKGDFNFGKSQKLQGAESGLYGDLVTWVIWCFTKKLCMSCDARIGIMSWWSCQSPVVHSYSLLNHLNSFHRTMFKLNAKFDADSLLYSVILNVTATQYMCSL